MNKLEPIVLSKSYQEKFEQWKKRYRKRYISTSILIYVLLAIVFFVIGKMPHKNFSLPDIIFGVIASFCFIYLGIFYMYKWIKSASWKVEGGSFGEAIKKSRYSAHTVSRGRKWRRYYVTASVQGQSVEARCEFETYRQVERGDTILLFHVGGKEIFALK